MWWWVLTGLGGCVLGPASIEDTGSGAEPGVELPPPGLVFDGPVPQHVLMISIDTLRRDALSRYGGTGHMPWLDALAEGGVVLDDHRQCAPWTLPGTTCALAGRSLLDMGIAPWLDGTTVLPDGAPLLATWLFEAGFQTVLRSTNLWLSEAQGNAQGYRDFALLNSPTPPASGALDSARQAALELDPAQPWLVHVHLMEPHAPYDPPEDYLSALESLDPIPWDLTEATGHYRAGGDWPDLPADEQALLEAHLRARYDAELAWLDDQLEEGLAAFEADGLLDDTLVVVWSDHGEAFFEHGFQGHARDVYAEETRALLIFDGPGLQPLAWDGPTHATDLAPTLLRLYGLPVPEVVTGIGLGAAPDDRPRFAHALARNGGRSTVEADGWSLHFDWETGGRELYDTVADPGERDDLFAPDHPEVARLWDLLRPPVERAEAADDEVEITWP